MNTGFLTFCEDQPGLTMLKDEPEDLTHLAPTAGDVCVPLDDPPFLTDMLDEFILGNNYCPLLSPELSDDPSDLADSVCNSGNANGNQAANGASNTLKDLERTILGDSLKTDDCSSSDGDPFIYRDSSSRCSLGTDLHSPTSTKSPESSGGGGSGGSGGCSDSLSSPFASRGGDSLINPYDAREGRRVRTPETELLPFRFSDADLESRAPYIPMCDQDETLHMLMFDDMVMWGPSQDEDEKPKLLPDIEENTNSSLAQLLTNESSLKQQFKDHNDTLIVNPAQVLGQISLKNTTQEITAERERTHKRVHAYSTKASQGNKRLKPSDLDNLINSGTANNNNNTTTTTNNNGNKSNGLPSQLGSMLSSSVQNSQLLQQLMSQQQQVPKSRNWPDQMTTAPEPRNRFHASDNNSNSGGTASAGNLFKDSNLRRLDEETGGGRGSNGNSFNRNSSLRRLEDEGGGNLDALRKSILDDDGAGKSKGQQRQSNSVLMNLLVSGCDVSAGYVCLTKQNPRSSKGLQANK